MNQNELKLWQSVIFKKQTERSDSLILVILGNLDHFRRSFIALSQSASKRG